MPGCVDIVVTKKSVAIKRGRKRKPELHHIG